MKKNKIRGTLFGAAYGDSLGAITEFCTPEKIKKAFPTGLSDYGDSISPITKGIRKGCVTDDFGSSCYLMKSVLRHGGLLNREIAMEAILEWAEDPVYYGNYAGQNTRKAIERLKRGEVIDESAKEFCFLGCNTNGGAMKAAPAGLLAAGDVDSAVALAVTVCWPTHYNAAAASGAAAVASAVCEAQKENTTIDRVIEQAIYGAKQARKMLEKEGYGTFGPYLEEKIADAVWKIKSGKMQKGLLEFLNSEIGTGMTVQESVTAVFAMIAACEGDFYRTLRCAVNVGGDTDTMASMAGGILGGYHGVEVMQPKDIECLGQANTLLELEKVINDFTEFVYEKERRKS